MAGVSVKMGVDASQFKKGIDQAKSAVKTLDAELKLNEKQLKATGDAETYAANKSRLLNRQLDEQNKVVQGVQKQLEEMKKNGVDEASEAYQRLERSLYSAAGKMMEIQAELNDVKSGASNAKDSTRDMNTELRNIGKGVAFGNITEGLKNVTDTLKSTGTAAINLGKKLVRSAMDSSEWADDVLTRALRNGVDAETIQRMDNVAKYIDTDVDTIIAAKGRLAKNKDSLDELLGISVNGKSVDDAFWEAGSAIMAMTDEFEREEAAQKVFGKGWKELIPLFSAGQQEYEQMLAEQNVLSNEQVKTLGEMDDEFNRIKQEVELLKNQFWAENGQTVINLLQWVIDNKDGVVTALTAIGGAFAAMKIGQFGIELGKVVQGFQTLLGKGAGTGAAAGAGAGGGSAAAGGGATAAKAGLFSRVGAWFADAAGVSAGGALIGTGAIAAGVIALGETVKELNRQWRGTVQDDAHRYDNLGTRDQQVIQTTIRGIMGGESPMSREWQMRWFAQNMGGRIWDAFNYTDAGTGEQRNRLGVLLGMDNAKSAEAFALIAQAYGLRKDRMGNYDLTSSAALQSLMNSDAELNRLITGGATSYAMYQQTGNKVDYANLWQDLTSFFDGSMMKDGNGQYWTPELYAEKLKADEEAAAKVTELGNSSDHTGEFVRLLGEESETSAGHVSKFGELAGGAEHSVDALGGAAARAAGALASIHAPTWATHANGIWYVPWDGYPAILHKGERVTPAREMAARSFSSNLYVENMNMGGGMDADALAAAIAGRNRRMMAGYGS